MDPSTGLTCVTCHLVFQNADVQRDHYRSDWHRYNMKRNVADLPPVTAEQFRDKVLNFKQEKEDKANAVKSFYCEVCKKNLKSQNALDNHFASNKHKELEKNQEKKGPKQPRKKADPTNTPVITSNVNDIVMDEEDDDDDDSTGWETDNGSDEEEYDYDESQAIPITKCLFCPQDKRTMEEKMEHMRFHHGFIVPDKQYLIDEKGLMHYLGLKVGAGRCCIYCPDIRSRFATVDSCQKHMKDKEHCKLARDPQSMLEFAEFYDYSPMYEGEESSTDVIYDDGWTLTLPSGAKIGHRGLMIYYRQYIKPVASQRMDHGRTAIDRAKGILPALAWTNTTGRQAHQIARDLKYIDSYRRRFDLRWKNSSNKAHRLFKTRGRVGDN